MGCRSDIFLVKLGHLEARGAQGQVQKAVGSWSSFDPIEGSDKKIVIIIKRRNLSKL
jgi:hypothetical protein